MSGGLGSPSIDYCTAVGHTNCSYLTLYVSVNDYATNFSANLTREEFVNATEQSTTLFCRDAAPYFPGCRSCVDTSSLQWTEQSITGCPRAQLFCGRIKVYDQPLGQCLDFQNCNVGDSSSPSRGCPKNCSYPHGRCVESSDGRSNFCQCEQDYFGPDCSSEYDPATACVQSPELLDLPLCVSYQFLNCDQVEVDITFASLPLIENTVNISSGTSSQCAEIPVADCDICVTTNSTLLPQAVGSNQQLVRLCSSLESSSSNCSIGSEQPACTEIDITEACSQLPQCPGTPLCSGHGQCSPLTKTCVCDPLYFGDDCSYQQQQNCLTGSSFATPVCLAVQPSPTLDCNSVELVVSSGSQVVRQQAIPLEDIQSGSVVTECEISVPSSNCTFCISVSGLGQIYQAFDLLLSLIPARQCHVQHTFNFSLPYNPPSECNSEICSQDSHFQLLPATQTFTLVSPNRIFGTLPITNDTASVRLIFATAPDPSIEFYYSFGCQPRPTTQQPLIAVSPTELVFFDDCAFGSAGTLYLSIHCPNPTCLVSFRAQKTDLITLNRTSSKILLPASPAPFMQLFRLDGPLKSLDPEYSVVVTLDASYQSTQDLVDPKPWPQIRLSEASCPSTELSAPWNYTAPTKISATSAVYIISGNLTSSPVFIRVEIPPSLCGDQNAAQCQSIPLTISAKTIYPSQGTKFGAVEIALLSFTGIGVFVILGAALFYFIRIYRRTQQTSESSNKGTYSLLDNVADFEKDEEEDEDE